MTKHHFDKRADTIIALSNGDDDDLMDTPEVAEWFGISPQWLKIGRIRGYGPPFILVAPKRVRYRRADVLAYLHERRHASTAEYATHGGRPRADAAA